jgi:glycerol uptake facilitator-like aquaporin
LIQVNEAGGYSVWDAWWVELWGTFLFTLNWLSITHCSMKASYPIKAMIVAIGLLVAHSIASGFSCGAINPAVGFNLQLWAWLMKMDDDNYHKFEQFWIYLAAPVVGAILSGVLHFCIHNVFDKIKAEHNTEVKEKKLEMHSHVDGGHGTHTVTHHHVETHHSSHH